MSNVVNLQQSQTTHRSDILADHRTQMMHKVGDKLRPPVPISVSVLVERFLKQLCIESA